MPSDTKKKSKTLAAPLTRRHVPSAGSLLMTVSAAPSQNSWAFSSSGVMLKSPPTMVCRPRLRSSEVLSSMAWRIAAFAVLMPSLSCMYTLMRLTSRLPGRDNVPATSLPAVTTTGPCAGPASPNAILATIATPADLPPFAPLPAGAHSDPHPRAANQRDASFAAASSSRVSWIRNTCTSAPALSMRRLAAAQHDPLNVSTVNANWVTGLVFTFVVLTPLMSPFSVAAGASSIFAWTCRTSMGPTSSSGSSGYWVSSSSGGPSSVCFASCAPAQATYASAASSSAQSKSKSWRCTSSSSGCSFARSGPSPGGIGGTSSHTNSSGSPRMRRRTRSQSAAILTSAALGPLAPPPVES